LKKQIIEALKAEDNDLYTLLKSQWAHRFGVESLEELKNLDLTQVNQNLASEANQKIDQSQDVFLEEDKAISIEEEDEKEIKNNNKKVIESVEVENQELFERKSHEISEKDKYKEKVISPVIVNKRPPDVKALIPLPPKPKYSFLKKWLLIG
tara:strand:+ start:94 stop:549 length:456 start_codon:yes stop_codon:yes gene_type:complete